MMGLRGVVNVLFVCTLACRPANLGVVRMVDVTPSTIDGFTTISIEKGIHEQQRGRLRVRGELVVLSTSGQPQYVVIPSVGGLARSADSPNQIRVSDDAIYPKLEGVRDSKPGIWVGVGGVQIARVSGTSSRLPIDVFLIGPVLDVCLGSDVVVRQRTGRLLAASEAYEQVRMGHSVSSTESGNLDPSVHLTGMRCGSLLAAKMR